MEVFHSMSTGSQVLTGADTTFIYLCVRVHMCVWRPLSSLAHLPRQKTPVLPAISQSDSCELDSGTREREEGGRERRDTA